MWYFAWVLGLGLALTFGILNALWNEFSEEAQTCSDIDCDSHPFTEKAGAER